ncbi:MAG: hypothetical protein ABSB36_06715 [Candidatus Dormibacteria bacterium]
MIPVVALLILIISGFAAISLDAGMDYAQSRSDNDVSDAAALAGAYWAVDDPSSTQGLSLAGLWSAENSAASVDGCNGQCSAPMVVAGSNAYAVAQLWTTTKFAAGASPAFYVNSSGACSSSASGTFLVATCPAVSSIQDVGAPVSDKTNDYFATVVGGHPVGIVPDAVAAVSGTGEGTTSTNPTMACEICVFGPVSLNGGGDELLAGGGSIDIGGYLWYDTSSATVQTSNGYGIDVDGTSQQGGASVYVGGSSDLLNANGDLGIDGPLYFNSSSSTVKGASTNISGTVGATYWQTSGNVITPSAYGTTAVTDFTDPMASVAVPTYTKATTNCSSVGTVQTGTSNVANCLTVSGSTATLASGIYGNVTLDLPTTVNPGEFESLTIGNSNMTITFNPGTYIFDGSGIDVNAGGITLAGTGLTFYMTCGSGTAPASCGTWTPSSTQPTGGTCSTTTSGSSVNLGGTTTLNLQGPTGSNPVLFFFDRCNSNQSAFWVDSPGVTAGNGYPTGMLYAHSGRLLINASTSSIPSPLVVGSIYYNAGSIVLGTATGSVALVAGTSGPGTLVN